MTLRSQNLSHRRRSDCLVEVSACIAEAETSTSAQALTVMLLARTGFDASDAVKGLWVDMDALAVLRDVRRCLQG